MPAKMGYGALGQLSMSYLAEKIQDFHSQSSRATVPMKLRFLGSKQSKFGSILEKIIEFFMDYD